MKRRDFFRNGALAGLGTALLSPFSARASYQERHDISKPHGGVKNIIFLVSDGMSAGTLTMADMLKERKTGSKTHWIQLYKDQQIVRALMDTCSADSLVTDSAAASSAWGAGVRVQNGALNIGGQGQAYKPILQKFKDAGKAVGCVTTVPITHATPAGFCVATKSRANQAIIAELYLDLKFDVMMGGGQEYFIKRDDSVNLFNKYKEKGYHVATNKAEMEKAQAGKPLMAAFQDGGLPYAIDHENDRGLMETIPTLAEMTQKAIDLMRNNMEGFVMQVEGGKVDWAAHGNDTAGVLYDQLAFDDAIEVAMNFARQDGNTLVIITTDHGNANPGLFYGRKADEMFDTLQHVRHSNEWILTGLHAAVGSRQIRERIEAATGIGISKDEGKQLEEAFSKLSAKDISNHSKLPYKLLADIQAKYTMVQWAGTHHTSDYVELAMYGPGSDLLKPFVINTDLHHFMLEVTGTPG